MPTLLFGASSFAAILFAVQHFCYDIMNVIRLFGFVSVFQLFIILSEWRLVCDNSLLQKKQNKTTTQK